MSNPNHPTQEQRDTCRLFVGNVISSVGKTHLQEHFGQYGTVIDVYTPYGRNMAFVTYATVEEMTCALAVEHELGGEKLTVKQALPKGESPAPNKPEEYRLYIQQIPSDTTDEELRAYFEQFGVVTDVFHNKAGGGNTKTYGFIKYGTHAEMYKCLAVETHTFKDGELTVEKAKPKPKTMWGPAGGAAPGGFGPMGGMMGYGGMPAPGYGGGYGAPGGFRQSKGPPPAPEGANTRMFVGGLATGTTDAELRDHFSPYGNIIDLFRPGYNEGRPKGFCFITYSAPSEMFAAMGASPHMVRNTELRVTEAAPKPGTPGASRAPAPPAFGGYGAPAAYGQSAYGAPPSAYGAPSPYGAQAYAPAAAPPSYSAGPSRRPGAGEKENRIFISQISESVTDDMLTQYFSQFGSIQDTYRPRPAICFIIYDSEQEMAKALSTPTHSVGGLEVSVTKARDRPGRGGVSAPQPPPGPPPAYDPYGVQAPPMGAYGQYDPFAQAGAAMPEASYGMPPAMPGMPAAADPYAAYGYGAAPKVADRRYHPY